MKIGKQHIAVLCAAVIGGGAGLGLAIARHLVISLGGTIAVEDRPGGGARFRITLPARQSGLPIGFGKYPEPCIVLPTTGNTICVPPRLSRSDCASAMPFCPLSPIFAS